MYWLAILLAAQVAASPLVVAPQHQNEKRLCILWIFGDCKTTTTSTPVPTSSSISSSYSQPSSSQPASPSATPGSSSQVPSSASPSPTATSEVVPTSLDPSSTVTPIITATPTPTGTPTSSLEPLSIPSGPFFSLPLPQAFSPGSLPPWGGFFSYSQAPVPSNTLSSNPTIFTAAAADAASIAQAPTVRNYEFNLGYSAGSPDGFLRSVMTINNRFPGPLIEANAGDTVVINVRNSLAIPASIHWHGIRQNGTNFMDGVPGISQCPIPPGGSFTYRFTLNGGEMGTYWYHSHYGNTMADGLVGGFIVHSPDDPLKLGQDYDEDRIVYVSDWMDDQSEVISAGISNLFKGYRGLPIVTAPDAVLVNGVGQVDCRKVQRGVPCNQNNGFAEITAPAGKRIRFRIINTGSHAMIRFSIDKHTLQVIEADDTPINAVSLREVPINTGQRYSVIATLDQGAEGSSFWIRANAATFCINPLATVVGKAILRYGSGSGNPTTSEWPDNANPAWGDCIDLDQKVALVPRIVESVGSASSTSVMNSLFGVFVDKVKKTPYIGFGMNGVAYTNYINRPLLSQLEAGLKLNGAELASITITDTGYADIIVSDVFVSLR